MADQKTEDTKKLSEEMEMKKHYKMLLQLPKVEMVNDLQLLAPPPEPVKPLKPKGMEHQ